jgi:plasmid rolling circle replication initiator protein Rep
LYHLVIIIYKIIQKTQELLSMKNKNPLTLKEKVNKRTELKGKNIKVWQIASESGVDMTSNTLFRMQDCGTYLEFLSDKNIDNIKLGSANFCGNRFCPHCGANKARKDALELAILLEYINQKYGYRFIFLTLTAPNVYSYDLENELKDYYKSFERLFKRKPVKAICKGYIRKLEMTYNVNEDTYHPHYHIILAVNGSYFDDSRLYINQKEWLQLWRDCKRDQVITQVDVRAVTQNNIAGAVEEMAKYIAKESNYAYSIEVFRVFYKVLKGKRYFSFNGVFKEAHNKYKVGELDCLKEKDDVEYVYKIIYEWNKNKYNLVDKRELTEEEKQKVNRSLEEIKVDKEKKRNKKAKLISDMAKIRKEKTDKLFRFRKKGGNDFTGEINFDKKEKEKLEKQIEFEKMVDKFNEVHGQ